MTGPTKPDSGSLGRLAQARGDDATLDLYKLAVEMADRVSARRGSANTFFLATETALVTLVGLAAPRLQDAPLWASIVVAVAGVLLSASWWLQLRSYRDLNAAKFAVIVRIEREALPVAIFGDEWEELRHRSKLGWRSRYAEMGGVERVVPVAFALVYLLLLAARLAGIGR